MVILRFGLSRGDLAVPPRRWIHKTPLNRCLLMLTAVSSASARWLEPGATQS